MCFHFEQFLNKLMEQKIRKYSQSIFDTIVLNEQMLFHWKLCCTIAEVTKVLHMTRYRKLRKSGDRDELKRGSFKGEHNKCFGR